MNAVATLRTRSAGLRRGGRMIFALVLALGGAVAAEAIVAKSPTPLDAKTLYHPAFHQAGSGQALATIVDRIPNGADWQRFLDTHGEQMVVADPVTGRVVSVSGTGIPWIPGLGNTLTMADLVGVMSGPKTAPGLPELETIARNFVASNDALFQLPADMSLALNSDASLEVSPSMWALRFDLSWKGIPIDGGAISFVVKHGNLVLWGATGLDDVGLGGGFAIGATRALALVGDYVGGFLPGVDTVVGDPRRVLVPERLSATDGYRSVWEIRFEREGEGSYLARVDASTGEILEFHDDNDYAQIKGGIYPLTNTNNTEVSRPFGFADYGTNVYADAGGFFSYTSGTVTSILKGKYVTISDKCGAISLSASAAPGDLDFSSSSGTDCTTPGVGGVGNTHSARSCYYHVDLIKQKGRVYLPSNAWLQANITANVNINANCNAFWSPTQKTINFYRSGGGCGNTGEIAAIFLHEWGHGMDYNDGNGAQGSGEAMGDTVAMLQLRNSCIGPNFTNSNCGGYGNACKSCTGVRDTDRAKHQSNIIWTPKNINTHCSAYGAGSDPCGYEVHCEGELAANTVWDLAAVDLPARADLTADDAWALADKLWWESGPTRTKGYDCTNKTGTLPWNNGCTASTWYQTFLAADDANGNLADGTPHATTIFLAFDRHGISCGLATDTKNKDSAECPTIGSVGNISATPGANQVTISWNSATNAGNYRVLRNNLGCTYGFTQIAVVAAPTLSYVDTTASNGTTWYYVVQPIGTNVDCTGPISNCANATPSGTSCSNPTTVTVTPTGTTTVCTGTGITFTAAATGGTAPVTYQWTQDGANVTGATSSTYTPNFAAAATHTYNCVVTGAGCTGGTSDTTPSTGTWVAAPTVDVTPNGTTTVCTGTSITFTATATGGTSPFTYQWTQDGANITGATASTYTVSFAAAATHTYNCKVASTGCATTAQDATAVTGTWVAPPTTVDVTPNGTTTLCAGNPILFTATVTGGTGLTYQWTQDGTNITGATSATYSATSAAAATHTYNCKVSSTGCATAVQDATASTGTWTAAHTVDVTPNGTTTVCTGTSITFTATPTGATGPTYQWTQDGTNITGATSSTYTVSFAAAATHTYNCKVTAGGCTVADPTAVTGTWVAPPTVDVTPNGTTTTCTNANITFTATATGGTAPYGYQWTQDGTNITGATSSTYVVTFAAAATHTYNCKVTSTGCATTAQDATAATGSWKAPATVGFTDTPDPSNVSQSVSFASTVTGGTSPFTYDWNWGDATAHGTAANPSHTYASGGAYTVTLTVTDAAGCAVVVSNSHSVTLPAGSCSVTTLFSDTFEAGTGNWSLASGTNPWVASTASAGSPTTSIDGADPNTNGGRNKCAFAAQASDVTLPTASGALMLSFWSEVALGSDDAGIVEVSTDSGASWAKLTTVAYPSTAASIGTATCPTPAIAVGDGVFAGTLAGATYRADITAFQNGPFRVRFTMVTGNTKSAASHWYVDDVAITNELGAAPAAIPGSGTVAVGDDAVDVWNRTTGGGNTTWTIAWGHVANAAAYRVYRSTAANALSPSGAWAPTAVAVPPGWTKVGADVPDSASPSTTDSFPSTDTGDYVYHVDPLGQGTCFAENYTQP